MPLTQTVSRMSQKINLLGRRFGRLVVVEEQPSINRRTYWKCKCDCGNYHVAQKSNLFYGHVKSCGCKKIENDTKNKKPNNYSQFRQLWIIYRMNARKRNLDFLITTEELSAIVVQKCFYCGSEPKNIFRATIEKAKEKLIYNGIDRYENSIGYVKSNLVPCCEICNRMKLTLSAKEFFEHIEKIASQSKRLTTAYTGLAGVAASPSESTLEGFTGQVGLSQPTANQ